MQPSYGSQTKWRRIYRVLAATGIVVGVALAVAYIISGFYLMVVVGAGSACRLLIYFAWGQRTPHKMLPNESQIAMWRTRK